MPRLLGYYGSVVAGLTYFIRSVRLSDADIQPSLRSAQPPISFTGERRLAQTGPHESPPHVGVWRKRTGPLSMHAGAKLMSTSLSVTIRRKLEEQNRTITSLAEELGLPRTTVLAWLSDLPGRGYPEAHLSRLCQAVGIEYGSMESLETRFTFDKAKRESWAGKQALAGRDALAASIEKLDAESLYFNIFFDAVPEEWRILTSSHLLDALDRAMLAALDRGVNAVYLVPDRETRQTMWRQTTAGKEYSDPAAMCEAWLGKLGTPDSSRRRVHFVELPHGTPFFTLQTRISGRAIVELNTNTATITHANILVPTKQTEIGGQVFDLAGHMTKELEHLLGSLLTLPDVLHANRPLKQVLSRYITNLQ